MAIKFKCPVCFKELTAPDEAAGNVGNCPRCGEKLRVPQKAEPILEKPAQEPTTPTVTQAGKRFSKKKKAIIIGVGVLFLMFMSSLAVFLAMRTEGKLGKGKPSIDEREQRAARRRG